MEGYTLLEYIEASGEQHIDTGFTPNNNSRMVIDFSATRVDIINNIIGSRQTTTSKAFAFSIGSNGYWRMGYNTSSPETSVLADTKRHIANMDGNVLSLDGQVIHTATSATFTGYGSIYIGAIHASSGEYVGYVKVYSCQIYDNGTLIRDYIPCKNTDGTYGLYDKVDGVFLTSDGLTGELAKNTLVVSAEELRRRLMHAIFLKVLINRDNYLTMTAKANSFQASFTNDVYYNINGYDWVLLSAGTKTPAIASGEVISFKAELMPTSSVGIGTFSMTQKCDLSGNCMSMLFGDEAEGVTSLSGYSYAFYSLFEDCKYIVNVSSGFLPATTLADRCYMNMFYGCTALLKTPSLPAQSMLTYCYYAMFRDCSSLTTAPSLPATTLADRCYMHMFSGTKLTSAPSLPAKTLKDACYDSMFRECTALTTAPSLPATTLANYCYSYMFEGCTKLTSAPSLPAKTLKDACYEYMFKGCIKLVNAPSLPATALDFGCYRNMFHGCTALTTAPALSATTLAQMCYISMFEGCINLTQAPVLPAAKLSSECYNRIFYGCTKLNYIKALFTTAPSSNYTNNWVYGVASTGTFVKNENATWDVTGVNGIPSGWTVETT